VEKNAALIVSDREVGTKLFPTITSLLFDVAKQEELEKNIKQLGVRNADEVIANAIFKNIIQH